MKPAWPLNCHECSHRDSSEDVLPIIVEEVFGEQAESLAVDTPRGRVLEEVGFKDRGVSLSLSPERWAPALEAVVASVDIGVKLQAVPGESFQPRGSDVYREGDVGTVVKLSGHKADDSVSILWDRTGRKSQHGIQTLHDKFSSPKAPEAYIPKKLTSQASTKLVKSQGDLRAKQQAYTNSSCIELHPVHSDGDIVEYFSPSHKIWLIGAVILEVETDEVGDPMYVYNVKLRKSGQVRNSVPLDMIRVPFKPTELVEVYSKRNAGGWVRGSVQGPAAQGNIMKGYTVHIDEQPGCPSMFLERVPSWRLRRRFPARSSIEVYRGPSRGWTRCVVHAVIEDLPAEPPVPLSPLSPGSLKDAASVRKSFSKGVFEQENDWPLDAVSHRQPWSSSTQYLAEDATLCGSSIYGDGEEAMMVHPWVQVPVYIEEWDEVELGRDPDVQRAKWVPSYLIRMRMISQRSNGERDRRAFLM